MAALSYVSTRGQGAPVPFRHVLLSALAPDGGLYMPERWPRLEPGHIAAFAGMPFTEAAFRILRPFIGDALPDDKFRTLLEDAYAGFGHEAVAPLVQTGPNRWLLELFHGPTLAFKDVAMQLLARLLEAARDGDRPLVILGATSGDTGAAAVEAVAGRRGMALFMLYPKGRVSDVQRRQMTTCSAPNVHVIAVDGTFDDCQAIVKRLLTDGTLRNRAALSGVNSINWARVMAQSVYYVTAAAGLGGPARAPVFVVPSGNFGNVFAGYAAYKMGLPVSRFLIATNRNDILARTVASGRYAPSGVTPTMSPAMDIQVASNFERLLYELGLSDGAAVSDLMGRLAREGAMNLSAEQHGALRRLFSARAVGEAETLEAIARTYERTGRLIDPHTAVAVAAADQAGFDGRAPVVVLATAHPAKFPEAVARATGVTPEPPAAIAALTGKEEYFTDLPADAGLVRTHMERHIEGVTA